MKYPLMGGLISATLAGLATAAVAGHWREAAMVWAEAADCVPARIDLVGASHNEEVYTVACVAPPTRFVAVRCSRYSVSAPTRPPFWCQYVGAGHGRLPRPQIAGRISPQ